MPLLRAEKRMEYIPDISITAATKPSEICPLPEVQPPLSPSLPPPQEEEEKEEPGLIAIPRYNSILPPIPLEVPTIVAQEKDLIRSSAPGQRDPLIRDPETQQDLPLNPERIVATRTSKRQGPNKPYSLEQLKQAAKQLGVKVAPPANKAKLVTAIRDKLGLNVEEAR